MVTRLEITHGLIPERERSSTSADTLAVIRPSTGSVTRSKGVLAVLVGSRLPGPRAREATLLMAETIQREYYYDESAGVGVCLEKAIRTADRRLKSSREGAGLAPDSLGVAAAVIRNDELYLATIGSVEAYLVRNARLLMPERSARTGLPAPGEVSIDVWRGELAVGDALLLVSRNVTETVGTEELKSAALTLHPQAAAEHLHHLYTAAGGTGGDGIIAIEAAELTAATAGHLVPAPAGDAYGDLAGVLVEPVGTSAFRSRGIGASVTGLIDRAWDAMPRRRVRAWGVRSRMSTAETRRRAAIGAMALVGVVFLLGLVVVLLPKTGELSEIPQVASGDSALSVALDRTERADNIASTEPDAAVGFYREAWDEIQRARATGLTAPELTRLENRVRAGLDVLYGAATPETKRITILPPRTDPTGLVGGPRGGAYYIDQHSNTVRRVRTDNGKSTNIVTAGDRARTGKSSIGVPTQIEDAGYEIVIVDDKGRPFRWRPSNKNGSGTLVRLTLLGSATFDEGFGDVAAYQNSIGDYRLYVVDPARNQIMRYQRTLDGSAFQVPTTYLVTPSAEVAGFKQLHVDFDIYALFNNELRRYQYSKYDGGFALADPPDSADIRPGHDYEIVTGVGNARTGGKLYLYDAEYGRIVAFDKETGSYVGQWVPGPNDPQMKDVRGMYVVPGRKNKKGKQKTPDRIYWISPAGLFESTLVAPKPASAPASAA